MRQIPEGIDGRVSAAYLNFMATSYSMHGKSGDSFRFMCEAQMLRNRVMARRIGEYLAENPDRVMVVPAGDMPGKWVAFRRNWRI